MQKNKIVLYWLIINPTSDIAQLKLQSQPSRCGEYADVVESKCTDGRFQFESESEFKYGYGYENRDGIGESSRNLK